VEARIVTWSTDSALKVPASACFRGAAGPRGASGSAATSGEVQDWAVFTVSDGRARLRAVTPGHRTASEVEILKGIAAGELVVLHPPNELSDGLRVSTR
jgi:HlyD family secretion protein